MPDTNTYDTYDTEDSDDNSTQNESINKILEETKIAYIEDHKNDFILAVTTLQLMASMYAGLIKNISLLMANGLLKTDVFKDLFKSIVLRGLKLNHWRVQLCQFMPSIDTSYFQSMFQDIDILINNCGTWSLGPISELKNSEIDAHYNNILKSTILGTKFASAYLGESGVIINVGSFAGILPMRNASIYSSFKSAINVFTRSSATELGKLGIRVNCITPGVIRTPMTSQYIDDNYDKIIEPIALGRVGSCEEVANAVLFLCSDLASYITGTVLEITGGKYMTQF